MVPGPGCGIVIINPVSLTALAGVWDNRLFPSPPHRQFVYLKVFIVLSRLCCTMSTTSMGKQTKGLCSKIRPRLTTWANSSLFEPAALVYLSRQVTGVLGLSGRVELMAMYGGVKNNYEHNVVVMNLPLYPKTADGVILIG